MKDEIRAKGLELSYIEYRLLLYKLAHKYKNVYDNDFDEALGDANLWFIKSYDSYDKDKAHFSTYLYHVVENGFIDMVRKKKKERAMFVNIEDCTDEQLSSYSKSLIDNDITKIEMTNGQALRLKTFTIYQDFIDILTIREQDVFKLYYYNNWSIGEISQFLNLSEVRVKQIKSTILNELEKERKKCKE